MKLFRFTLLAVLVLFSTMTFAQTDTQKPDALKSDAQESFDTLKNSCKEESKIISGLITYLNNSEIKGSKFREKQL